ncbi:DNA polymerase III subunit [Sediminibacterium salmoneum]|uniref:DNA polymerase III subunit n=1 Tax=Sediminibacterium salmoneum TaxID=426421 RepID=UPI00047AE1F0|nr:DNA polymerase III subunit delta' [Sediminibacterium salmoneum]
MLFSDVIGQDTIKQHLAEMVEHNRLSHALLFLAKEGAGGLPLALAFAQYIVSLPAEAPVVEDLFGGMTALEPSGGFIPPEQIANQPAYVRADKLVHPDLHFTYPVIPRKSGDKPVSADYIEEWRSFVETMPYGNVYDWLQSIGAENKQGNITAEECNQIIRELSLKSFESRYKVLLLWMPEYLGKEGNKLLKLIEEPPPNTVFILVAENEESILPTIISRCQLVRIPALEDADIEKALTERAKANEETARQITGICEGNYREALHLLQHADEDWQSLLREWLNAMLKTGPAAQLKFIDEVSRLGREKQKQFLRYFNHLLEQSIRIRVMSEEQIKVAAEEKDFAKRLNKIASVSQQECMIEELDKAAYYIERNAHAKMLFQALTIKLYHIIQNKTLILSK